MDDDHGVEYRNTRLQNFSTAFSFYDYQNYGIASFKRSRLEKKNLQNKGVSYVNGAII